MLELTCTTRTARQNEWQHKRRQGKEVGDEDRKAWNRTSFVAGQPRHHDDARNRRPKHRIDASAAFEGKHERSSGAGQGAHDDDPADPKEQFNIFLRATWPCPGPQNRKQKSQLDYFKLKKYISMMSN